MRSQYPADYNPPLRGACEFCGYVTKGNTKKWLSRCPEHWQALILNPRGASKKAQT